MKNKTAGLQKTAMGLLAGLILVSLLLIMPVSADAGEIVAWGYDVAGQCTNAPTGNTYTQVGGGYNYSLALTEDGSIVAWGDNAYGQCNVPTGNGYIQIAAGYRHGLALTADGTIVAWGDNANGQCNIPSGNGFKQIAGRALSSLALAEDGSIVQWGSSDGPAPTEDGFTQIAGGWYHSLALRENGTIVTWGRNEVGQLDNVPTEDGFTQIAAGWGHSLALTEDGTIVAWGNDEYNRCDVPSGNGFTHVAAGVYHSLALTEDGTIVAWGNDWAGQCNAPTENGFTYVGVGAHHSLAVKSAATPAPVASITADPSCNEGSEICFDASGSSNTVAGTTYEWTFGDGEGGSGVNVGHTYEQNGDYEVTLTVTNPDGQADTATTSVTVVNVDPVIDSLIVPEAAFVGAPVEALVHFSDAGQDTLTATWDWGDLTGEETSGPVFISSGNLAESHVYTAPGEYMITFLITDDDGGSVQGCVQISIMDEMPPEPPEDPTNTPEFPTLAVPSMLIVGLVGVLLLMRRRQ